MKSCHCLRALFPTAPAVLIETGPFVATSILTSKLPKNLADQWLLFTKGIAEVPELDVFLNFLKHKKRPPHLLSPSLQPSQNRSRSNLDGTRRQYMLYSLLHSETDQRPAQLAARNNILLCTAVPPSRL